MKIRAFILLFAFVLLFSNTSQGQVGNLLRNKLNRVVNAGSKTIDKEINGQIDTAVQKGVENEINKGAAGVERDQQENSYQSSGGEGNVATGRGNQGQTGAGFANLFGNKVDLKYKEEYGFTSRIYMVSETYDNDDVMKMDFFMYYSSASPIIGVETKTISNESGGEAPISAVMVMDGENQSFLMLTDMNGMKMGVISTIPDENTELTIEDGKKAKALTPPTITKTGNTRVIAGYKCDEYTFTDTEDKTTGKVWFTNDANLKIDRRGWKNSGMDTFYSSTFFKEGIILATETYNNKGKLISKSETKEINPTFPHSISVTGYTLRQMNLGQGDKK